MSEQRLEVTIEDGILKINTRSLMDKMDSNGKKEMAQHLAYDQAEELVQEAALGIIEGRGFFDDYWTYWSPPPDWLVSVRKKILERLPNIAKNHLEELYRDLDAAKKDAKRCSSWALEMYHAWPRGSDGYRESQPPKMPDYIHADYAESRKKADAVLKDAGMEVSE